MSQPDYSLDAIMAHPNFPFADWQQDDTSFLMLELFWAEFFRKAVGPAEGRNWVPRFDTPRDGNPILALGNPKTRRAFRVIVVTNEEDRPVYPAARGGAEAYYYFSAFLGQADEMDGAPPWDELGFFVELHPSILDIAERLIRLHCAERSAAEIVEAEIAGYEADVGMDQIPD